MFPSDIIERRFRTELGLVGEAGLAWWELLTKNGETTTQSSTVTEQQELDIDIPLELIVVSTWFDHLIRNRTNSPTAPTCTRAAIISLIPYKLWKKGGNGSSNVNVTSRFNINAEMFYEIHRFIVNTLIPFLKFNNDMLAAWRDGSLRLGDDMHGDLEDNLVEKREKTTTTAVTKIEQEKPLEETKSNQSTAAGSVFRIRIYRRSCVPTELILTFNFARSRRYIFLSKMMSGGRVAKYTWRMTSMHSIQHQQPLQTLGDFVDALWPYLCYVEIQSHCRRVLAPKYFQSSHWTLSWNQRYSLRLRDLLTGVPSSLKRSRRRLTTAAAAASVAPLLDTESNAKTSKWTKRLLSLCKEDQYLAACASGVGLDLSGNLLILPHFLMLRIWGLCCWNESAPPKPLFFDQRGHPTHPPPPYSVQCIHDFLQDR